MDMNRVWEGASLWANFAGSDYNTAHEFEVETVMGEMDGNTVITDMNELIPGVRDDISTPAVFLNEGTLESRTTEEVLNGANWCVIGNEICAFETATLLADKKYNLSGIWRGLRGTEEWMDKHGDRERFVLLDKLTVPFLPMNLASINRTQNYKLVAANRALSSVDAITHKVRGRNMQPFSPAHVHGLRHANDDVDFTWKRRTRAVLNQITFGVVPLLEEKEEYLIEVLDPADNTVIVKEYTVTNSDPAVDPTWTYTAAQRTADGLTASDPVHIIVYMMSTQVGKSLKLRSSGGSPTIPPDIVE